MFRMSIKDGGWTVCPVALPVTAVLTPRVSGIVCHTSSLP